MRTLKNLFWRAVSLLSRSVDMHRWQNDANLDSAWAERTQLALEYLHDANLILELGAGKGVFRNELRGEKTYIASDVVARTPDYLLIDISKNFDIEFRPDAILALGVLEYVGDVPAAVRRIGNITNCFVFSYSCHTQGRTHLRRRLNGWLSHFSEEQIRTMLKSDGWAIEKSQTFETTRHFIQIMFKVTRS